MSDCCGSRRCTCTLIAGPGVEIDGSGSTGNPYVISAPGGGGGTPTVIQAGDTATVDTTVTGTGTAADPVIISGTVRLDATPPSGGSNLLESGPDGLYVECADVRGCFSAGDGAAYDPATGEISARPSADAGNTTVFGSDGGIYTPSPVTAVATDCGLTGDGSAGDPLTANTGTWPYPCDIDTNSTGVYCDPASGELRADPPFWADFEGNQLNTTLTTPLAVPAADTVIDTISIDVTNPDPCRPALGLLFREVDLSFVLPPNSGGEAGVDGDDLYYVANTGSSTVVNAHSQNNKLTVFTLAPGETRTITMNVEAGRGTGGATITRIQKSIRAWTWSNRFN
jgi:hypothetical protein